jgi:hypothetical protein
MGAFAIFALFVTTPSSLQVPVVVLHKPDATLSRPFERITGLHELRDGRVIVVDANEQSVLVADFTNDRVVQLGRQGSGPGEYRLPVRLLKLGGDSIGVEDGGNGRILVVTGTGRLSGILDALGTRMGSRQSAGAEPPRESDHQGRLYALPFSPFGPTATRTDSAPIERWSVGSQVRDTVAYLPLLPANRRVPPPGAGTRAFDTAPQWTVGPEGQIAILHVDPYSVDVVDSRGRRIVGRPIAYQPIRVSDGHKREWREELARPQPVTITTPRGVRTAGLQPLGWEEPVQWPAFLPPFLDNAGRFAPDGVLWIQRAVPVDGASLFDLVDGRGVVIKQVRAREHSRVVGFGVSHVYVVRIDQDDQEFLERYKTVSRRKY